MTKLLDEAITKVKQLPESQQDSIAKMMLKMLESSPEKRPLLFGSDKDIISITDDFDEPLSDFEGYSVNRLWNSF